MTFVSVQAWSKESAGADRPETASGLSAALFAVFGDLGLV